MATKVTVNNGKYTVESLYQWDINQVLEIYGLSLPSIPEIHFTNDTMDRAIVRRSTKDSNGVITVEIPNSLLQKPYTIKAYVCIREGDSFRSLYSLKIPVKARKKPGDYTLEMTDEEVYSFNKLEYMVLECVSDSKQLQSETVNACNETIESVNAKCTATIESVNAKCDDTVESVNATCQDTKTYCASILSPFSDLDNLTVEFHTLITSCNVHFQNLKTYIRGGCAYIRGTIRVSHYAGIATSFKVGLRTAEGVSLNPAFSDETAYLTEETIQSDSVDATTKTLYATISAGDGETIFEFTLWDTDQYVEKNIIFNLAYPLAMPED